MLPHCVYDLYLLMERNVGPIYKYQGASYCYIFNSKHDFIVAPKCFHWCAAASSVFIYDTM